MMTQRSVVSVQQGVWIDSRRLAEAGLHDSLEIVVQPGEITIRSAAGHGPAEARAIRDIENAYPLSDESFHEGWNAPGMEDYDRYEELRKA